MLARKDAVLTGFCILPVFYELQLSKPIKRYKRAAKVFAHVYIAFSVTTQRLLSMSFWIVGRAQFGTSLIVLYRVFTTFPLLTTFPESRPKILGFVQMVLDTTYPSHRNAEALDLRLHRIHPSFV